MCTVTIIPLPGGGFRMAQNRDELRTRRRALPVRRVRLRRGAGTAVWPVDPESGGTWIAATSLGVVMTTMNVNPTPPPPMAHRAERRSRGRVIPDIADARSAAEAIDRLADVDLSRFAPFRLVAADLGSVRAGRWDGVTLDVDAHEGAGGLGAPLCFVSSGLGDDRVTGRLGLFGEMVDEPTRGAQDAFHHHTWVDAPEVSVMMARPDARTVSMTSISVHPTGAVHMTYRDLWEGPRTARVQHVLVAAAAPAAGAPAPEVGVRPARARRPAGRSS